MSFWSKPEEINQIRHKFAFKVEIQNVIGRDIYYAKSVDKPSISIKPVVLKYLFSHEVKFPGRPTWNPIRLTLYNIGPGVKPPPRQYRKDDLISKIHDSLDGNGYTPPDPDDGEDSGDWFVNDFIFKKNYKLEKVEITQLSTDGAALELWSLKNPFIVDFKYDTLDYTQEGPTMIDLTLAYDWATLT